MKVTRRVIDGVRYKCVDVGCEDLERAKRNRLIVKKHLHIQFYLDMEYWFQHATHHYEIPSWIPLGTLPQIGKREGRHLSREERHGPNLDRE